MPNTIITQKDILLASASISMLYKRAFRKEKEVITFLIKARMIELTSGFANCPDILKLRPEQGHFSHTRQVTTCKEMLCCY
jgi:hypothetical protein